MIGTVKFSSRSHELVGESARLARTQGFKRQIVQIVPAFNHLAHPFDVGLFLHRL